MEILNKATTPDGVIILGVLLLNLLVGIYLSKGITNIKQYALGNRNFSTATIVATIVATWLGGGSLSITAYETYENGVDWIIPGLADDFSFFIYALGNRNFSTATIVATIVATWLGGGSLSITAYETYENGVDWIIPGLADDFSFFIIAYFYALRMQEFLGKLSIAEAMGAIMLRHVRQFQLLFLL